MLMILSSQVILVIYMPFFICFQVCNQKCRKLSIPSHTLMGCPPVLLLFMYVLSKSIYLYPCVYNNLFLPITPRMTLPRYAQSACQNMSFCLRHSTDFDTNHALA